MLEMNRGMMEKILAELFVGLSACFNEPNHSVCREYLCMVIGSSLSIVFFSGCDLLPYKIFEMFVTYYFVNKREKESQHDQINE